MSAESPDLAAAMRLLDVAKDQGFVFERVATGEDGPLRGVREGLEWWDEIWLAGCSAPDSCWAIRRRSCSLIVPGGLPIAAQVSGDALTVLYTVVREWEW